MGVVGMATAPGPALQLLPGPSIISLTASPPTQTPLHVCLPGVGLGVSGAELGVPSHESQLTPQRGLSLWSLYSFWEPRLLGS